LLTVLSLINVWRARQRCLTHTTKQRMTITFVAFVAAPLAVFPYLIMTGSSELSDSILFWLVAITGNAVVGIMFALLTAHLIYFGAASPDRVVRVRLFKFMARVPLAGTIVLLVYIVVSRNSPILGLPSETALGFALVATVMLVEWVIHAYKRPLERFFQLNDDPYVRRIQEFSERLLTTADLHQFLESVLAATCESLRTPTSFVAAITDNGPRLEAVVGPLAEPEANEIWQQADWHELTTNQENGSADHHLQTVDEFILWQNYWIRPLHNQQQTLVIGIFGIRARAEKPNLNDTELQILDQLIGQAETALQDRILQQEVFGAVEGLLPQIKALQQRRSEATFGGLPVLTAAPEEGDTAVTGDSLVNDPEFKNMVRDALTHYWGGPKLTKSPLLDLQVVQQSQVQHGNNPTNALRAILADAIELQKPEGERNLSTTEWILYNILELKFVQGRRVRDVARRLAMSESDLYRKQRVAIENVAQTVATMEKTAVIETIETGDLSETAVSTAPSQEAAHE
jgi:GAF domain-containing protein